MDDHGSTPTSGPSAPPPPEPVFEHHAPAETREHQGKGYSLTWTVNSAGEYAYQVVMKRNAEKPEPDSSPIALDDGDD